MIHQLSLDEAVQRTDEAIALVELEAGDGWMAEALTIIERVAKGQPELTVNDIWKAGLSEPKCNRAIGAAMRKAREGPPGPPPRAIRSKPLRRSKRR